MPVTITIKDETTGGKIIHQIPLSFDQELTTVRTIILTRVNTEVELYNKKQPEYFPGLVQPKDAERTLNGYKIKDRRKVDATEQCRIALEAFGKNGYFVLIDNIQSKSLDQMVVVNENTNVSFVKLTPLIGG